MVFWQYFPDPFFMKTASLYGQGAWVQSYFSTEYIEVFATDGEVYKFRGSLIADFEVDGVDLSHMVWCVRLSE